MLKCDKKSNWLRHCMKRFIYFQVWETVHAAVELEAAHAHSSGRQTVPVSSRELQVGIHHQAVLAGDWNAMFTVHKSNFLPPPPSQPKQIPVSPKRFGLL